MPEHPASDLLPLFEELASPVRLRLLYALAREPGTVTGLGQEVALSPQEVSRHLNRLGSLDLVSREVSRAYRLTPFGKVLLEELPAFAALQRHRRFFDQHDFSGLPDGLAMRPLAGARHVVGNESDNMQTVLEALRAAEGPVAYVGNQLGWLAPALRARAREGAAVELVLPWTLAGTEALLAYDEAPDGAARRTAVRLVEQTPLLLTTTPGQAFAFFATRHGGIDFTHLVAEAAPEFRTWAGEVLAGVRARSLLAFDPARDAPGDWRRAITVAAGRFVSARGMPPANPR